MLINSFFCTVQGIKSNSDERLRERETPRKGNLATALCKPQEKTRHTSAIIKPIQPCEGVRVFACACVCAHVRQVLGDRAWSGILINFFNARSSTTTMSSTMRCDVAAPRIML